MCGRFTVRSARRVKLDGVRNADLPFAPRYNIAPGQEVMAVANFGNGLELATVVWGLIPAWSGDGKGFINARAETLETKPSFSDSFQKRRCLIPADGFYEWRRTGRARQAFYFQLRDEAPFAFAGLWDRWGTTEPITSCGIITTAANETLQPVHDRMPVILDQASFADWLDPKTDSATLQRLLAPFPATLMSSHPVSSAVNHPDNDSEHLIARVDSEVGITPSLFS